MFGLLCILLKIIISCTNVKNNFTAFLVHLQECYKNIIVTLQRQEDNRLRNLMILNYIKHIENYICYSYTRQKA